MIELAIQAQTDGDARQVLRDAVLESGWWDARVVNMLSGPVRRGRFPARCYASRSGRLGR